MEKYSSQGENHEYNTGRTSACTRDGRKATTCPVARRPLRATEGVVSTADTLPADPVVEALTISEILKD